MHRTNSAHPGTSQPQQRLFTLAQPLLDTINGRKAAGRIPCKGAGGRPGTKASPHAVSQLRGVHRVDAFFVFRTDWLASPAPSDGA